MVVRGDARSTRESTRLQLADFSSRSTRSPSNLGYASRFARASQIKKEPE